LKVRWDAQQKKEDYVSRCARTWSQITWFSVAGLIIIQYLRTLYGRLTYNTYMTIQTFDWDDIAVNASFRVSEVPSTAAQRWFSSVESIGLYN
jgi:hypothetical protein